MRAFVPSRRKLAAMPARLQLPTEIAGAQSFAAPVGPRVRVVTLAVFLALALLTLANLLWPPVHGGEETFWPALLGPAVALPIAVPLLLWACVRGYRLVGGELHVVRLGRVNRFALDGLLGAEPDHAALDGAWKIWANDGLGAVTGRFGHKRLGRFDALVTDGRCAVVLRWPDRCLVVSPDRPREFAAACRERAGLVGEWRLCCSGDL